MVLQEIIREGFLESDSSECSCSECFHVLLSVPVYDVKQIIVLTFVCIHCQSQ